MKADNRFIRQPKTFWAHVRSISQHLHYTDKKTKEVKVPSVADIKGALNALSLKDDHICRRDGTPTDNGQRLHAYFQHRAEIINGRMRQNLMDSSEARALFEQIRRQRAFKVGIPMNKQKGEKKAPAYLTAITNILIERHSAGFPCDFDPRELTSITRDRLPIRTLARRVDGAFPTVINPVAVWEIKEYYYTTTFGSRVADGVYESLLDGLELEELRANEGIDVKHYLILDGRFTWWDCGRSYLCRVVDMLHMGYVDEVLVGREIVKRLPELVAEWVAVARRPGKVNLESSL
jgi:hypothetical protein